MKGNFIKLWGVIMVKRVFLKGFVEPNGLLSHWRFIENGVITGKPNPVQKK
ncbi:hypothetical protein [Niallia taxi]|uniref:hypothetical protein n=1 Tax=Niallia taxi TaxID=2499688 RepID=UPI0029348023|nr:hypothetical protein [Niallia taxi]WOD65658.1 nickel-dependent hydrogenase large subunit [Niallia taxi]